MLKAVSGDFMRAAPMPPEVENFMGQPMFRSMPAISSQRRSAAARAVTGLFEPICNIKFGFSEDCVRKTRLWSLVDTKSIVPRSSFTNL